MAARHFKACTISGIALEYGLQQRVTLVSHPVANCIFSSDVASYVRFRTEAPLRLLPKVCMELRTECFDLYKCAI